MMPGGYVRMPGGGVAHVRYSNRPRRKCSCCKDRRATLECDYPDAKRKSGLCDKPLCAKCAVKVGKDLDHCPHHPRDQAGQQMAMEGL